MKSVMDAKLNEYISTLREEVSSAFNELKTQQKIKRKELN